jgi:peptidoglycan/LPS O-acetylase OafA/YrhL
MNYRKEIDGLRAIAVWAVIFYHAGLSKFPGGFLGVDVFFVISGFLISSLALTEYEKTGKLHIGSFFKRRIKRILPALLAMVVCCICMSPLLSPVAALEFYETVLSIPFFVSNIVLYTQSGYFAGGAYEKLLLHTWSLAVEEQFYIIFPFSFLLFIRLQRNMLIFCISLIIIISFSFATWASINSPNFSFFSMPSRLWELLSGSFTAIVLHFYNVRKNDLFAFIGLFFLIIAFFFLDKGIVHPGPLTTLPIIGTCLLLLFVDNKSIIGRVLANRILSWFGLISYSLYLWHVPVFSFYSFFVEAGSGSLRIISIIITVLISYLSYRWIEVPFRNDKKFPKSRYGIIIIVCLILVFLIGIVGIATKGFYKFRYSNDAHDIVETLYENHSAYVRENFEIFQNREWDQQNPKPNLLIIGDSYAQDVTNIFMETSLESHYEIRTFRVGAKCGNLFLPKQNLEAFQPARIKTKCINESLLQSSIVKDLLLRADIVILSSQWKDWQVDRMLESITYFHDNYDGKILVVGSKLFPKPNIKSLEKIEKKSRSRLVFPMDIKIKNLNSEIKAVVEKANAYYFDIQEEFCLPTKTDCRLYDSLGRLKSYDGKHLTRTGAKFLAPSLENYIKKNFK